MDLSKAKTILILAFLALNLFLGYRLWLSPQLLQTGRALSGDEAEKARELLVEAGFEPAVAIPRQIPHLALLHVSREQLSSSAWGELFLGENAAVETSENGSTVFSKNGYSVTVAPNGQVVFRGIVTAPAAGTEDNRQVAERYLRELGLWHDDLKFDGALWRELHGTRYRYVQMYQGFPLFFSALEVVVAEGRFTEIKSYRVSPQGFSQKDIQAISALDAVEVFVELRPRIQEKRIVDISLGYFSEEYDAERWEIPPVWRFVASDGATVYINAFTGEVEALVL